MILALDIGNLTIQLGCYDGETLSFKAQCASDRNKTEDEYVLLFRDLLLLNGVSPEQIEGGIISAVVPQLSSVVGRAVRRLTGQRFLTVGSGVKTGLNIRIDDPSELGSGMVVDAVAAIAKYPKPIVIFDMDTATSMSVIGKDGAYLGGALMPGLKISVDAMAQNTAQLPYITLEPPDKLINSSTVSCMQAGAIYGCAAMLDGLASGVDRELGESATMVLTGNAAPLVAPYCMRKLHLDEDLQLEGMRIIYEKNRTKRRK